MDRRFRVRREAILAECQVSVNAVSDLHDHLQRFVQPFAACLQVKEQQQHTQDYVAGLLSGLERKNAEAIAYLHNHDRRSLQRFLGEVPWEHYPLQRLLVQQVGHELGEAEGVIVFDPSGFAKKGTKSVGVARQWLGRLGKVDNGQVGIYMGYASSREHTLVDFRLYLPKEWATDRRRRKEAGVPREVRYQTRHAQALDMLAKSGPLLPHAWVVGDDEMGRPSRFRCDLRERNERYLLAVPSNTNIRDQEEPLSPTTGRGRPRKAKWRRVDQWRETLPNRSWMRVEVRPGEKGPLIVEVVKRRVKARTEHRQEGPEEILVVFRVKEDNGDWKHDYFLSNAPYDTPLTEFARAFKALHRIEECLQRAKGEAGLAHYEVRTWLGWHHHQILSLMATWFLVQETRAKKKPDAGTDGAPGAYHVGKCPARPVAEPHARVYSWRVSAPVAAERRRTLLALENP